MAESCPTCGRPLGPRLIDDAKELLRILGEAARRTCYRTTDGTWHYTYSGGDLHVISGDLVKRLAAEGKIKRSYSNSDDSYGLGRTIDVEATMSALTTRGAAVPIIYLRPSLQDSEV